VVVAGGLEIQITELTTRLPKDDTETTVGTTVRPSRDVDLRDGALASGGAELEGCIGAVSNQLRDQGCRVWTLTCWVGKSGNIAAASCCSIDRDIRTTARL
jgi:hypothetical protein